jgi:hypothetical protein
VKVRFTSAAELEVKKAMEDYETAEKGLGAAFLSEVEAAQQRIRFHPLAWAPVSRRTRRCRTHRFPFGLFYQVRSDEVLVVSVMDLRRDPKRWEQYL